VTKRTLEEQESEAYLTSCRGTTSRTICSLVSCYTCKAKTERYRKFQTQKSKNKKVESIFEPQRQTIPDRTCAAQRSLHLLLRGRFSSRCSWGGCRSCLAANNATPLQIDTERPRWETKKSYRSGDKRQRDRSSQTTTDDYCSCCVTAVDKTGTCCSCC
jgi:hypothetical protein